MTHETEATSATVIPMRKPAAWVLRGDARAVERARKNKLPIHTQEE